MKFYRLLSIFLIVLVGCYAPANMLKPPLGEKGEVFLYLQPASRGSEGLRFSIGKVSAVRDEDNEVSLELHLNEVNGAKLGLGQQLLGSGIVPPGRYNGISLKIDKAFLRGEEGEGALIVPDAPVFIKQSFEVKRKSSVTLFLSFNPENTLVDGFRFAPTFSLQPARRELLSLIGYVSNPSDNTLTEFNKKTLQITGMIATGGKPRGIALDQVRSRVYVAAAKSNIVEVIDITSREIIGTIRLGSGDEPEDLALSPDGRILVTVNHLSNTASILDTASRIEVRRVRVGNGPTDVVINAPGSRAYVISALSSTISVIDLLRKEVLTTATLEGTPFKAAFSPEGDRLYVISRDTPHLLVIDSVNLTVRARIFIGTGAASVKVDRQTGLVYVGKILGGEIAVVDPASGMFIDTIKTDSAAAYMTIDGDENALFALLPEEGKLVKIGLTRGSVGNTMKVSKGSYAVTLVGER